MTRPTLNSFVVTLHFWKINCFINAWKLVLNTTSKNLIFYFWLWIWYMKLWSPYRSLFGVTRSPLNLSIDKAPYLWIIKTVSAAEWERLDTGHLLLYLSRLGKDSFIQEKLGICHYCSKRKFIHGPSDEALKKK